MRGYHIRLGDTAATVPAAEPAPISGSPVIVAAQLMGVAALPWIPVLGGAWLGKRYWDDTGKWVGGLGGFALSVGILASTLRKIGT